MDIYTETYNILGQRLLSKFDSKSYVDWAIKLMANGYESDSLLILAGLDNDSTEDREKYFFASLDELEIKNEKSELELIDGYVIELARQVVRHKFEPRKALSIMLDVISRTDYLDKYLHFYDIDEDIYFVTNRDSPLINQELNKDNIDDFIINEFKIFLDTNEISLDKSLHNKAYCNSCGQIIEPVLKTKYQFREPFSYRMRTCPNCNSNAIYDNRTQKGREKLIEYARKTAPNTGFV
jgi:RNase P subunit RPR2